MNDEIAQTGKSILADPAANGTFWGINQAIFVNAGRILLLCVFVLIICMFLTYLARKAIEKALQKIPGLDQAMAKMLYTLVRTVIWIITALVILDLFGFNTSSILTVLGAAGLTIGLAMKDSLSNVSAGIMLLALHPYKAGDYIDCGTVSGIIRELGLFTTILQTVDGLFVSVPNSVLFGNPIKNYSRNPLRRADITVGISYSDNLVDGLKALQGLMEADDLILKTPPPQVMVADLADSSVNLTLRYWTATADYWTVFWRIKGALKETLEGAGLTIPFPQRVVTFANAAPEQREQP